VVEHGAVEITVVHYCVTARGVLLDGVAVDHLGCRLQGGGNECPRKTPRPFG